MSSPAPLVEVRGANFTFTIAVDVRDRKSVV